jgi:predicted ArsR family transcriptional regulator
VRLASQHGPVHLNVLTSAGLVLSQPSAQPARGRPRLLYAPASSGGAGDAARAGYEVLAEALAAGWADQPGEGAQRAERAGWALAAEQGLASGPPQVLTSQQAAVRVSALFAELSFDPELGTDGAGIAIRLHAARSVPLPWRTLTSCARCSWA